MSDGAVGVGSGVVSQHLILRSRWPRKLCGRRPQVSPGPAFLSCAESQAWCHSVLIWSYLPVGDLPVSNLRVGNLAQGLWSTVLVSSVSAFGSTLSPRRSLGDYFGLVMV